MRRIALAFFISAGAASCSLNDSDSNRSIPQSVITFNLEEDRLNSEKIRETIIYDVINGKISIPFSLVEDDMTSRKFTFLFGVGCEDAKIESIKILLSAARDNEIIINESDITPQCSAYVDES